MRTRLVCICVQTGGPSTDLVDRMRSQSQVALFRPHFVHLHLHRQHTRTSLRSQRVRHLERGEGALEDLRPASCSGGVHGKSLVAAGSKPEKRESGDWAHSSWTLFLLDSQHCFQFSAYVRCYAFSTRYRPNWYAAVITTPPTAGKWSVTWYSHVHTTWTWEVNKNDILLSK